MFTFKPHAGPIYSIAFSPDGNFLVTSAGDETVKVTDLTRSEVVRSLPGFKFACPVAISRDGRFLARGGFKVAAWEWSGPDDKPLVYDPGNAGSIAFSPDGQILVAQTSSRPLRRWAMPSGAELPGVWGEGSEANSFTESVAFSADGALLASSFSVIVEDRYDSVIMLWNARTGSLHGRLHAELLHSLTDPTAIVFSPDGSILAGIYGPGLLLFDVASRKRLATVKPGKKHFKGLAFTPDGRQLVTVSNDRTARVWAVPTLDEQTGYEWKIGKLTAIAIAPDGMRAAAGSDTGKVIVWDMDG